MMVINIDRNNVHTVKLTEENPDNPIPKIDIADSLLQAGLVREGKLTTSKGKQHLQCLNLKVHTYNLK